MGDELDEAPRPRIKRLTSRSNHLEVDVRGVMELILHANFHLADAYRSLRSRDGMSNKEGVGKATQRAYRGR
jgi:hypothetical protein